ncbi:MAG TPA: hypothetical protein DCY51_04090 [Bacteroidetes bacterium]|nr:hypothetical protein [Bacteroidota bacterium]
MNFQKLVFKFIIVLTYLLRVALLVLPIALVVVITKEGGWKYGFTFIQNSLNVAFFVSFAIGFLVSVYHAVSFDEVEGAPDQNYMKSHQVVHVSSDKEIQEVMDWIVSNEKYKDARIENGKIYAKKKVHFLSADKVEISKSDGTFTLSSRPFAKWWFIDFARNYKTVKALAKFIKLNK